MIHAGIFVFCFLPRGDRDPPDHQLPVPLRQKRVRGTVRTLLPRLPLRHADLLCYGRVMGRHRRSRLDEAPVRRHDLLLPLPRRIRRHLVQIHRLLSWIRQKVRANPLVVRVCDPGGQPRGTGDQSVQQMLLLHRRR